MVRIWGSVITAFFELEVNAKISGELGTGTATRALEIPPRPEQSSLQLASHGDLVWQGLPHQVLATSGRAGRRTAASDGCSPQQISLSVDAEISVYAWAVATVKLSDMGYTLGSPPHPKPQTLNPAPYSP